jgi:hypothetical protein
VPPTNTPLPTNTPVPAPPGGGGGPPPPPPPPPPTVEPTQPPLIPGSTPVAAPTRTPLPTPVAKGVDLRITGISRAVSAFQPFAGQRLAQVRQSYNVTYSISYENVGVDAAPNAVMAVAASQSESFLLGPGNWSGSGGVFTGSLGTVPGKSSGTAQLLIRSGLLDAGDTFSSGFAISSSLTDLQPADNTYDDSFEVADTKTGLTPTNTATPTATLRPNETPRPTNTPTQTPIPTATSTPMATSVIVAPDIPSILTNNNGSVTVLVPPGAVTTSFVLTYQPEEVAPTPTPAANQPTPTTARRRIVQAFRLLLQTVQVRGAASEVTFQSPVIVTINYDQDLIGTANPAGLSLARVNEDGTFDTVPSIVDSDTKSVSASITSTGSYALVLQQVQYRTLVPMIVRPSGS